MLILIGSSALKYNSWFKDIPKDIDLIGSYDEIVAYVKSNYEIKECYPSSKGKKLIIKTNGPIIEAEITWDNSSAKMLYDLIISKHYTVDGDFIVAPLNILYMLKMSHRYLKDSPHFKKTMAHIRLMRDYGAKFEDEYLDWYKIREKETYNYNHPKLNTTKKDFFSGDGIQYQYDHDSIHLAVKCLEKPAYQYFSNGEVMSDMGKFKDLPEDIKLFAVLEESMVLAAERSQIPFMDRNIDPKWSFDKALEKVCSSITSGYFREFAWENYYNVQLLYDSYGNDYMNKVKDGIQSGLIKPFRN